MTDVKTLKAPKKFFDYVKEQFPIYVWENKKEKIISSERKKYTEVIKKRLTLNSRLTFSGGWKYFTYIAVSTKKIEVQTYRAYLKVTDGKEKVIIKLFVLEKFENDLNTKMHSYSSNNFIPGLPSLNSMYQGNIYNQTDYYNFDKSLMNSLQKKSELKYLNLSRLYNDIGNLSYYSFNTNFFESLRRTYKYRALIEYAQKIGANGIAKNIINKVFYNSNLQDYENSQMNRITFNFIKQNKVALRNSEITFGEFMQKKKIEDAFGKCVDCFERFCSNQLRIDFVKDNIPVKPVRFQNWVLKNNINYRDYKDYYEMLKKLSIEFIGDRIVLPKDFEKAHQDAIDNYNALKHKIDQQDYQERYEKIKGLNTIIDDYQFIVPQDLNEIVKEGKTLSHCVGGYTSRHKKGETTIVLIRQVEKPLESYYTMEMHEGRLIQVRGYKNCAPDFQLKSTVETYISFANKQKIHY